MLGRDSHAHGYSNLMESDSPLLSPLRNKRHATYVRTYGHALVRTTTVVDRHASVIKYTDWHLVKHFRQPVKLPPFHIISR
jgi:hypothetical protein